MARSYGLLPQRVVFEYCDRPAKLEEAYLQMAMALIMYGAKLYIEMNKGGWRAYDWFCIHYPHLLDLTPSAANSIRNGVEMKYGVKMNQDKKLQMEGLLNQYLDNYVLPDPSKGWKGIQSIKFLEQCKVFGGKGKDDDLAVSYGWNLIIQQADKKIVKQAEDSAKQAQFVTLQRIGGQLKMMNGNSSINTRNIPKHPLFNK
jgi:hypothetical protein